MLSSLTRVLRRETTSLPEVVRRHARVRARVDPGRPIEKTAFVAVDTELTGLDFRHDSIVSIGAVRLDGTRILPGQTFYRLVKPSSELKRDGVVVHELRHSDLEDAAAPREVLKEFLDFVGDRVLVGHFAHIEANFIGRALKENFGVKLRSAVVDTAAIHDWLVENEPDFARHHGGVSAKTNLFLLADRYGIDVDSEHNAFFDAYVTAQLFQKLVCFLPGAGVRTLGELLSVGKS